MAVKVSDSAVLLAGRAPHAVTIRNLGPGKVYVGGYDVAADDSAAGGFPLGVNGTLFVPADSSPLYGVIAGSSDIKPAVVVSVEGHLL